MLTAVADDAVLLGVVRRVLRCDADVTVIAASSSSA